ncbi:MAG: C45 family autoproteolytic acyltransferase/hydrolase [Bacteroidetes bacterium]|nr:C45 family autoproteolytic acyltransferase/hydrolase [Bacteroidota bacterium]
MQDKRPKRRKKGPIVLLVMAVIILFLLLEFHFITHIDPPKIINKEAIAKSVENPENDFYTCGNNWLKKNRSGLWELYLEGEPFERGVINGKLTKDLIAKQEDAFIGQIREIVPSPSYLKFLKYFIYWFNRNLDKYIPEEYKQEIYGISLSASEKYSFIGSGYQRMLNYHSAHDIGHTLQNLGLVGCTSFGVWGKNSRDSSLLIGRNFDFYAGDKFAENKIVCFEKPNKGYPFMMVTWGGMIGVVSGMNDQGLTVTINAARSDIPLSARMPVSILAREILQYARNIDEAYKITLKQQTFVSESFLIGSAIDGKAVTIEKTPSQIALYDPKKEYIICANHFLGGIFCKDPKNRADRDENASWYRSKRVLQDITNKVPMNPSDVAAILRDQSGMNEFSIGMGNEKSINQLIAHHSIIFEPAKNLVWISTNPWQLGSYVCYNLNKIFHTFANLQHKIEITDDDKIIAADPFLRSTDYHHFLRFREMRKVMNKLAESGKDYRVPGSFIRELIDSNPENYEVYAMTGDYYLRLNLPDSSIGYYRKALRKVIPRWKEKSQIIRKLADCMVQKKEKERDE